MRSAWRVLGEWSKQGAESSGYGVPRSHIARCVPLPACLLDAGVLPQEGSLWRLEAVVLQTDDLRVLVRGGRPLTAGAWCVGRSALSRRPMWEP